MKGQNLNDKREGEVTKVSSVDFLSHWWPLIGEGKDWMVPSMRKPMAGEDSFFSSNIHDFFLSFFM